MTKFVECVRDFATSYGTEIETVTVLLLWRCFCLSILPFPFVEFADEKGEEASEEKGARPNAETKTLHGREPDD